MSYSAYPGANPGAMQHSASPGAMQHSAFMPSGMQPMPQTNGTRIGAAVSESVTPGLSQQHSAPPSQNSPAPRDAIRYGVPYAIGLITKRGTVYVSGAGETAELTANLQGRENFFVLQPTGQAASGGAIRWTDQFIVASASDGSNLLHSYQPQIFEGPGGSKRVADTADCPLVMMINPANYGQHAAPRGTTWGLRNAGTARDRTYVTLGDEFHLINIQMAQGGQSGVMCVPMSLACQNQGVMGDFTISGRNGNPCVQAGVTQSGAATFLPMHFVSLTPEQLTPGSSPGKTPSSAPGAAPSSTPSGSDLYWIIGAIALAMTMLLLIVLLIYLMRKPTQPAAVAVMQRTPISPGFSMSKEATVASDVGQTSLQRTTSLGLAGLAMPTQASTSGGAMPSASVSVTTASPLPPV